MIKKIFLLVIILVIILIGWRVANYFFGIAQTAVKEELRLSEIAKRDYSFYYPKGWLERKEEGTEIAYFAINEKKENTGEGITLEVLKQQKAIGSVSEKICSLYAQDIISLDPKLKGKTVSVVITNTHPLYEGCKVVSEFYINGSPVIFETKAIWYKDGRNSNLYVTKVNYFNETSEELKSTIKDAVNQLSLR